MKYTLFKGCFIPIRLPHLEKTSIQVLSDLGVNLHQPDSFSCCPEPVGVYINDRFTGTVISARNLALAEESGNDLLTLCNGCTYTLRQVNHELKTNDELREKVNNILSDIDLEYKGTITVRHFAEVLYNELGTSIISKKVERPLSNLKIATHTGCHILSPQEIMDFDDTVNPEKLDELVTTLGAEPVDYLMKPVCCGWTLSNYGDRASGNMLLADKLVSMNQKSADCVSVICPQCFAQFDTGQLMAARSQKLEFKLPVQYYLQLLGLAMGYTLEEIGYSRHRVRNKDFEEKIMEVTR
jgi:heterodisulfide reductase subunit B